MRSPVSRESPMGDSIPYQCHTSFARLSLVGFSLGSEGPSYQLGMINHSLTVWKKAVSELSFADIMFGNENDTRFVRAEG